MVTCPICDKKNDDNWPVLLDNVVVDGGCQEDFEAQADKAWWDEVITIEKLKENKL